ncbi:polyprenyl diphosphate synthase [Streptomyces sp. NPDC004435]|uniref:polyprenyl diphosphate synthase n=1 Tax=Streptomyces sp. NPDC004435 TaxID=3364701 RepID=UPI00368529FE
MPRHLALIMDGNRRWAQARDCAPSAAYQAGARRVQEIVGHCDNLGIAHVTVWALSRDNLTRPADQVKSLIRIIVAGLAKIAAVGRSQVHPFGSLELLEPDVAQTLRDIAQRTCGAPGTCLHVGIAYDGRHELVGAVRSLLADVQAGSIGAESVTAEALGRYLWSAGLPDLELLVRTSGEQRLSGFMPWQETQAELYFTDTAWPDFDSGALDLALATFAARTRRLGQ